jgi:hypothetical protein
MKKLNLLFGILLLVLFALSGQYMQHVFKPEFENELVMRMQIRASHIYILFLSALNVMSFLVDLKGKKWLDYIFRNALIVSGTLSFLAFWTDHTGLLTERSVTLWMVISMLVGMGAMLIHFLSEKWGKSSS